MADVFISYSRKDIAFARLLHKALADNGLDTWIDWQDIPPSAGNLLAIGRTIQPDPQGGEQVEYLTASETEQMACLEHSGWCEALQREGWLYTPGRKDPAARTHPALVPW